MNFFKSLFRSAVLKSAVLKAIKFISSKLEKKDTFTEAGKGVFSPSPSPIDCATASTVPNLQQEKAPLVVGETLPPPLSSEEGEGFSFPFWNEKISDYLANNKKPSYSSTELLNQVNGSPSNPGDGKKLSFIMNGSGFEKVHTSAGSFYKKKHSLEVINIKLHSSSGLRATCDLRLNVEEGLTGLLRGVCVWDNGGVTVPCVKNQSGVRISPFYFAGCKNGLVPISVSELVLSEVKLEEAKTSKENSSEIPTKTFEKEVKKSDPKDQYDDDTDFLKDDKPNPRTFEKEVKKSDPKDQGYWHALAFLEESNPNPRTFTKKKKDIYPVEDYIY